MNEVEQLIKAYDKFLVPAGKHMVLFRSIPIKVRDDHDEYIVNEYNKEYENRVNKYMSYHYGESEFYSRRDLEMIKYHVARELNEHMHYQFTPRIKTSGDFTVEDNYDEEHEEHHEYSFSKHLY